MRKFYGPVSHNVLNPEKYYIWVWNFATAKHWTSCCFKILLYFILLYKIIMNLFFIYLENWCITVDYLLHLVKVMYLFHLYLTGCWLVGNLNRFKVLYGTPPCCDVHVLPVEKTITSSIIFSFPKFLPKSVAQLN